VRLANNQCNFDEMPCRWYKKRGSGQSKLMSSLFNGKIRFKKTVIGMK